MVLLFNYNKDILECGNYLGIKIIENVMKILERMDERVKEFAKILMSDIKDSLRI